MKITFVKDKVDGNVRIYITAPDGNFTLQPDQIDVMVSVLQFAKRDCEFTMTLTQERKTST